MSPVLTSHGRPVAVVDSAARLDDNARRVREASLAVLDAAAHLVCVRSKKFSLVHLCDRLGLDVDHVRRRAAERAKGRALRPGEQFPDDRALLDVLPDPTADRSHC